jgi:hypothetical protein
MCVRYLYALAFLLFSNRSVMRTASNGGSIQTGCCMVRGILAHVCCSDNNSKEMRALATIEPDGRPSELN